MAKIRAERTTWSRIENRNVFAVWVNVLQWVVRSVDVLVQSSARTHEAIISQIYRIRRHEPPVLGGHIPSPKVIKATLAVPFLAGEFVILRAVVRVWGAFDTERIEVGVIANRAARIGDYACSAQLVWRVARPLVCFPQRSSRHDTILLNHL